MNEKNIYLLFYARNKDTVQSNYLVMFVKIHLLIHY